MENKYKIKFEKSAKQDLKMTQFYIKEILKEPQISGKLVEKIFNSIAMLEYYPEIFQKIGNLSQIRRLIVKNYNILYFINKEIKKVYILHIYHKSKNIKVK